MALVPQIPALAIVRRELVDGLRKRRSFACLALLSAVAVLAVMLLWPGEDVLLRDAGEVSNRIAGILCVALLAGSILFIPAIAGVAVVGEREQETYDMLRLTMVRPIGLILAKLANALMFFLLLAAGIAPALATTFFLVGLDVTQVAAAFGVVVATSIVCAMIGIATSSIMRRTFSALVLAYAAVFFLLIGGPNTLTAMLKVGNLYRLFSEPSLWAPPIRHGIINPLFNSNPGTGNLLGHILGYYGTMLGVSLSLSLVYIARPPRPAKVDESKPIDDPTLLWQRKRRFPFYLLDPLRRKKAIEDERNPMMIKEMRWGLLGKETRMVRLFYGSFVLFTFIGITQRPCSASILLQIAAALVLGPALLGNTITKEYELGNMDMLRLTLLRPRDVLSGKLIAGAFSTAPIVLAALLAGVPAYLLAISFDESSLPLVTGYITLLVCAFASLCISLYSSVLTRRTTVALILAYAVTGVLFFGVAHGAEAAVNTRFVESALPTKWQDYQSRAFLRASTTALSPMSAYSLVASTTPSRFSWSPSTLNALLGTSQTAGAPGFNRKFPWQGRMAFAAWLVSLALFLLLASLCLRLCARVLSRRWVEDG